MAEETAELAEVLRRTQRRRQEPIRMPFLEPSTIEAIRLRTPRHIVDVAGMDESHLKALGLEEVKQRHPVHPSGCHHDGGQATGREPVGETRHITGTRAQLLDRLDIAVSGHTAPLLLSTSIDASGMRVDQGHIFGRGRVLLTFFGQTCLQSDAERGRTWEERTPSA